MHLDKHCTKMLVEYAQIMSTAHRELDIISKNSLMDVRQNPPKTAEGGRKKNMKLAENE